MTRTGCPGDRRRYLGPLAILVGEPGADELAQRLFGAPKVVLSAGTLAEALIVADRRGFGADMRAFLATLDAEIVPVDAAFAGLMADAYFRCGKGVHPAGLNLGDCFAYALARDRRCPLLFVGDEFARTDAIPA